VLTALLSLTFFTTGASKLANVKPSPENFTRWGLSMTFMHVIGVIEVSCAIGLLFPRAAPFAALALFATMIGALRTGIVFGEALHIVVPTLLLVLLALLIYERRNINASPQK
jgi:uncharacterized membrane protein YphA (DoxX/SURF4 family)